LFGLSFLIFTGAFVVDQSVRWTDWKDGFLNGVLHLPIMGATWVVLGLLPGLVILGLFRLFGWRRFRGIAILSPVIVAVGLAFVELVVSPTTPASRLKRFTGVELPASAREIRTKFEGGGLTDYCDWFFFQCTAADTEKLIADLKLTTLPLESAPSFHRLPSGWPYAATMRDWSFYSGEKESPLRYITLATDASRERVFLEVLGN
jgi:hypothetical protein